MRIRFGARAWSLVLVSVFCGWVCGISAQVQTPSANKAVGSSPPVAATGNKTAPGESSSAETVSANTKAVAPTADPSAADTKVPQGVTTPPISRDKAADSYIVGIADSLFISVWKEADFSGPVVVRPDGIITLPVVGDVHVAGLTTLQVQDVLTEKLKPIVTEPQVTVIVRDISSIRSRKVYLVGKVGHPGTVSLTGHETVLQVIAEAGGPSQFAKPKKMYVLRTIGDHQKRIQFDYKKVLAGSEPDLELVVGDVIVVP
jgi:polysaccharide biosynthesis/export protein